MCAILFLQFHASVTSVTGSDGTISSRNTFTYSPINLAAAAMSAPDWLPGSITGGTYSLMIIFGLASEFPKKSGFPVNLTSSEDSGN